MGGERPDVGNDRYTHSVMMLYRRRLTPRLSRRD